MVVLVIIVIIVVFIVSTMDKSLQCPLVFTMYTLMVEDLFVPFRRSIHAQLISQHSSQYNATTMAASTVASCSMVSTTLQLKRNAPTIGNDRTDDVTAAPFVNRQLKK